MSQAPTPEYTVIETLLDQLVAQRQAYLESSSRIEDLLSNYLKSKSGSTQDSTTDKNPPVDQLEPTADKPRALKIESPELDLPISEERGDTAELCVSKLLDTQIYHYADLFGHVLNYRWQGAAYKVLGSLIDDIRRFQQSDPFDFENASADRPRRMYCEIIDVDRDGVLHPISSSQTADPESSRTGTTWNVLSKINTRITFKKCVGRITTLREGSPLLFAAIHFVNLHSFDTDELLQYLVDSTLSTAHIHRPFDPDPRRQRSFVFSLKYFTLTDENCESTFWQKSNKHRDAHPSGLSMSQCGAVIALSLQSVPLRKIRNQSRSGTAFGYIYDPWSPWQVVHLPAFADRESNVTIHNRRHYVNGVEAFMEIILAEYKDAERRLRKIYIEVTKLTTSPIDFMFDPQLFDRLFRDDEELTYSQRYFWIYQTCGLILDTIKALIEAYETAFTYEVWQGEHPTLWPLPKDAYYSKKASSPSSPSAAASTTGMSARDENFKNRMDITRTRFISEISKLRNLSDDFTRCRTDIISQRDQLFNAISIDDTRKAIQQGKNIKLLTLVSIFFLPLTYVTSVFGMNNMPTTTGFIPFGIATVAICIPFFAFVGFLNSWKSIMMKFDVSGLRQSRWRSWFGDERRRRGRRRQRKSSVDIIPEIEMKDVR